LRFSASPTTPAIGPNEQHRQAAGNRYKSDQDGRLGDLVSEDPGNQQLEPAHRIADPTGKPQA
jgi:hypothetical protein